MHSMSPKPLFVFVFLGITGFSAQSSRIPVDVTVRQLTATPGPNSIELRWRPVTGVSRYVVYVSAERFGTYSGRTSKIEVAQASWNDLRLSPGTRKFYAVAPRFPTGEGRLSGEVEAEALRPAVVPELHLTVRAEVLRELYSRSRMSDEWLPVALAAWNKQPLRIKEIRFGGRLNRAAPKKSFRIRLDERPAINFGNRSGKASDHLVLNSMWFDPSGLRDYLTYAHYQAIGLPAPRTMPIDLYINGSFEGHYLSIERIDREAIRAWKLPGSDGGFTLIRDEIDASGSNVLRTYDDAKYPDDAARIAYLRTQFDYRGSVDEQDWIAVLDLVRWARRATPNPEGAKSLTDRVDLDQLIDYLAVHEITGDGDGAFSGDYWLYRPHGSDGKWRLIPWDNDLAFGNQAAQDCGCPMEPVASILPPPSGSVMGNALVELVVKTPELRSRLVKRIAELYERVFSNDWYLQTIRERLPELAAGFTPPAGRRYELHPQEYVGTIGDWPHQVEALLDFIDRRRVLSNVLASPKPLPPVRSASIPAGTTAPVVISEGGGRALLTITPIEAPVGVTTINTTGLAPIRYVAGGVQRQHSIEVDRPLRAEVTFYVPRNNFSQSNRFIGTGADEFERRWFTDVVEVLPDGSLTPLRTRSNPFSGATSAVINLEGRKTFFLIYGR